MRHLFTFMMALLAHLAVSAQGVESVPYMTSFDNTYREYDGKSYIPVGWMMTGDNPFYTASMKELDAYDGTYYLVSTDNLQSPRNEHLYTPLFRMEKGRSYEVSYQLYMPGLYYAYLDGAGRYAVASHHPTHRLTVGEEQDYEFHTTREPLITIADSISSGWHYECVRFTPEATGDYCFCLSFNSDDIHYGDICIDDFKVTYDGAVLKPTADFSHGGMFNLFYSCVMDFLGGGVPFTGITSHADGCEWTVTDADNGSVVATSKLQNPRFEFPETGNYEVELRAYNSEYEAKCSKKLSVQRIGSEGFSMTPIYTYGETVSTTNKPNTTPVIGLDSWCDFASGPNHTYRRFAERIEMPENVTLTLTTLQYFLSQCSFASLQSGSVRTIPFTFAIYGETNGLPDEGKKIWSKTVTMNDAFSTNTGGLGGATQLSTSLDGANVSGTFYVAFEFDDTFPIDPWNDGGDRSLVEMTTCQHADGVSRIFYKDQKTGEWHPLSYFHPGLGGLGLNLVLWTSAKVSAPVIDGLTVPEWTSSVNNTYDLQGRVYPEHQLKGSTNGNSIVIRNGKVVMTK